MFFLPLLLWSPAHLRSQALNYTVSWVGNSFNGKDKWIPHDVADLCVLPDGTLFTNTFWEEGGGNVMQIQNGSPVTPAYHAHG